MRLFPFSAFALLAAAAFSQTPPSPAEVEKVHRSAILIDAHNDFPLRVIQGADIAKPGAGRHTDLPRLRAGGVGATFFAAFVSPSAIPGNQATHKVLELIDAIRHGIVEEHPRDFLLALTAEDIERAHREGKIAALIGIEGGHAIEDSLGVLRDCYALGARYMTLTWSNTNNWADSSGDERKPGVKLHGGLTDFGRQVVAEMNRLGMMVDISHVSDKTFWDVLAASKVPVCASHSCCRALCAHPRNLTDEMILALARKGGVIHINFSTDFLASRASPPVGVDDLVAHIDHVARLAGVDAVGIGSDFDGITGVPAGLEDVSKFPALTRALLAKGYSAGDIRKIYGGNTLRLLRAVQAGARAAR